MNGNPSQAIDGSELGDLEIALLLEGVFRHRGFDFRGYDSGYVRERIMRYIEDEGYATISALQERILHEPACMEHFLQSFLTDATSLFADPTFFAVFTGKIVSLLRPSGTLRLWVAECDGRADAYSLAILMREASPKQQVRLYATGMDERALEAAKRGVLPDSAAKGRTADYRRAGGKGRATDYYTLIKGEAHMAPLLYRPIVWAQHNLVTDASFNQFHCIVCRNTLNRFSAKLRQRVGGLLYESLTIGGVLGVGAPDDLRFVPYDQFYEQVDGAGRWFRKIG